jgi:hypothetical protein
MRSLFATVVVVGVASLVLASASAGPPPPVLVHIGVTHEQPTAGRLFTGLAFTPVGGAHITQVICDARVGRKELRGRLQRFYQDGGPALVTCGWLIPAGGGGKRLHLVGDGRPGDGGRAFVFLSGPGTGTTPTTIGTPVLFWHVRP